MRYLAMFLIVGLTVLMLNGWLVRSAGMNVYWLIFTLASVLAFFVTWTYYLLRVLVGTRRIIGDVNSSKQWREGLQNSAAELLIARESVEKHSSLATASRNFSQIREAAGYFGLAIPDHVESCATWAPEPVE